MNQEWFCRRCFIIKTMTWNQGRVSIIVHYVCWRVKRFGASLIKIITIINAESVGVRSQTKSRKLKGFSSTSGSHEMIPATESPSTLSEWALFFSPPQSHSSFPSSGKCKCNWQVICKETGYSFIHSFIHFLSHLCAGVLGCRQVTLWTGDQFITESQKRPSELKAHQRPIKNRQLH